jgi:DNA-binding CsgD family transcriptional regulator
VGGRGEPPGPLVGRQQELTLLRAALDQIRAGEPRLVLVEGAAGIGKTALLRRLLAEAVDVQVLWSSGAHEEQLVPYGVVEQLAHSSRTPLPKQLAALGKATVRNPDPVAMGAAFVDLLGSVQAGGPVAVVVDDAQWADRPSLLALLFALRRLQSDRVLCVIAVRENEVHRLPEGLVRLGTDEGGALLQLSGLDVTAVQDLSSAVTEDRLSIPLAEQLREHTGGNPLHLEALLKELPLERLERSVGVPLPSPRSYSMQMVARLARCSQDAQRLVIAASVLGLQCPLSVVHRLSGVDDPLEAVENAIAAGLLETRQLGTRLGIAFPHALTRSAIYHDVGPARRRDLHLLAAELVEDRAAALQHRSAAALDEDDALATDLADYGREEAARAAWSRAAAAMLRASELSSVREQREARLLEGVDWLITGGDLGRAEAFAEEIGRCADGAYPRYLLGRLAFHAGRPAEGHRLLLDAWRAGDLSRYPQLAGRIASEMSLLLLRRARSAELLTWAERAMAAVAEGGGVAPWAQLAYGLAYSGRALEGLADFSSLPEQPGELRPEHVLPLLGRGLLRSFADDFPGARADFSAVEPAGARWGPFVFRIGSLSHLASIEYRLGAWDDALTHVELALSVAEAADETWMLSYMHLIATAVLAGRGQWEAARSRADAAATLARSVHDEASIADASMANALIAAAGCDHAAVVGALTPVATMAEREGIDEPGARWRWQDVYAGALISLDRLDEAEAVVAGYEELATARQLHSAMANAGRVRGLLHAARKQTDAAEEAFQTGLRHAEAVTVPFDRAQLEFAYGRLLRRAGRRTAAVSMLTTARERFAGLGAAPYVERCVGELSASGIRSAKTPDSRPRSVGLTAQEGAVARLVAQGLTNREVAAQLVVSLNTIEYHLKNVYSKLGITSRSQLAARLTRA